MPKFQTSLTACAVVAYLFVGGAGPAPAAEPLGSGFTFQGQLKQGGAPLNNTADFEFTLWDAAEDGNDIGGLVAFDNVTVVDGLFTLTLNAGGEFGADALNGEARFLEVAVRSPAGGGDFIKLNPRTQLTATPYALQTRGIFVDDNLSVGIGTNTPTEALDVVGTVAADALEVAGTVAAEALEVVGTVAADRFVGDGSGLTGFSGSTVDLDNVALLRWDLLNRSFAVGSQPWGVAFDGANIWVVNQFGASVTKLRASDGANLGTFPVGSGPMGVAFDGANIWTTNVFGDDVTKLRASDGTDLGTFPVGDSPIGVAFDGDNIWVTNQASDNVTKLRAFDGALVGTFPVGNHPVGVTFDGDNIWVAIQDDNNVTKLRASDGTHLGTFPVGSAPRGVAFDGATIWVTNLNGNSVTRLRASNGLNLGTFPAGLGPSGIAFDGANIWVTNHDSDNVTRISLVK